MTRITITTITGNKETIMNKTQFRSAYSYYRKTENDLPFNEGLDSGISTTSLEWLADHTSDTILEVVRPNNDILAARAAGYRFAEPSNRYGFYGWQNAGYTMS